MNLLPDFSCRAAMNELMDAPDCDETLLLRTINQFASINRLVARYRTILKRWVLDDMMREPAREYHLVDMGAGGCDIDIWLLKAAHKRGLKLQISACDIDPRIIDHARSSFGHIPGLHIRKLDLLSDPLDQPVDYVFANHFLHHLTGEQIIRLLQLWQPRVRRRMVFSDLLRNPYAYLGFSAFSLLYRNSFARTDGLISIRRGFTPAELASMADIAAPNGRFSIYQLPPGRLVLLIDGEPTDPA